LQAADKEINLLKAKEERLREQKKGVIGVVDRENSSVL